MATGSVFSGSKFGRTLAKTQEGARYEKQAGGAWKKDILEAWSVSPKRWQNQASVFVLWKVLFYFIANFAGTKASGTPKGGNQFWYVIGILTLMNELSWCYNIARVCNLHLFCN